MTAFFFTFFRVEAGPDLHRVSTEEGLSVRYYSPVSSIYRGGTISKILLTSIQYRQRRDLFAITVEGGPRK
jgi:hypothetical protein